MGIEVGSRIGTDAGSRVGIDVGCDVGSIVGADVGCDTGDNVGRPVGCISKSGLRLEGDRGVGALEGDAISFASAESKTTFTNP